MSAAAYGIAVKLDSFAILPCSAVNDAVASFTAQNLGAGKQERAFEGAKEGRKLAIIYVCFVFLTIFFFGGRLAGIFTDDTTVISAAGGYLKIACFMYFLYALCIRSRDFSKAAEARALCL